MGQNARSPLRWLLLAVALVVVFGLGLTLMPRLLAATTYVPPTATPSQASPTPLPATATRERPTPVPTSSLTEAPAFALPAGQGISVTLVDKLADGPVVVVFFPRVGG